jgi:hypothetical protein
MIYLTLESKNSAKKYVSDKDTLELIASKDPSKNFKYTELMAKFISQGADIEEVEPSIKLLYKIAEKYKGMSLEVNSFKSITELDKWLGAKSSIKSKTEIKKLDKLNGAEKVFENDKYIVLKILTKEAAILYGKGTEWCISALKDNAYDDYRKYGQFYFIIFKQSNNPVIIDDEEYFGEDRFYKIAVRVYYDGKKTSYEIYDAEDNEISMNKLKKLIPELSYNIFTAKTNLSIEEVVNSDSTYSIDRDGFINVIGGVNLNAAWEITQIPFKFGIITGNFDAGHHLISLQQAPKKVLKRFTSNLYTGPWPPSEKILKKLQLQGVL